MNLVFTRVRSTNQRSSRLEDDLEKQEISELWNGLGTGCQCTPVEMGDENMCTKIRDGMFGNCVVVDVGRGARAHLLC